VWHRYEDVQLDANEDLATVLGHRPFGGRAWDVFVQRVLIGQLDVDVVRRVDDAVADQVDALAADRAVRTGSRT